MKDLLDKINNDLNKIFYNDQKRLQHIYGVRDLAVFLGNKLGVDPIKCELAALLHDITKNFSLKEHKELLTEEEINKIECNVLFHAYSAAALAKKMYKINEKDVIIAIRSHVYGNLEMSLLDKIILVSDFCEENRTYESCIKTRKVLLSGDFDKALKMTLQLTIDSLYQRKLEPSLEQLEICRKYGE